MSELTSVKTSIGELRCYRSEDKSYPGFSIYFVPEGSDKEVNIAMIQVPENSEGADKSVLAYLNKEYISPRVY